MSQDNFTYTLHSAVFTSFYLYCSIYISYVFSLSFFQNVIFLQLVPKLYLLLFVSKLCLLPMLFLFLLLLSLLEYRFHPAFLGGGGLWRVIRGDNRKKKQKKTFTVVPGMSAMLHMIAYVAFPLIVQCALQTSNFPTFRVRHVWHGGSRSYYPSGSSCLTTLW